MIKGFLVKEYLSMSLESMFKIASRMSSKKFAYTYFKDPFTLYRIAIVVLRFFYRIGGTIYTMPMLSSRRGFSNERESHVAL